MKLYLDTEINQILDEAGQEVKKLSEAESNLLAEFIRTRGKCLSREQLLEAGWPKVCVVENSLNMAIRKLRAIGINIETIARKGYVLVDDSISIARKEELHLSQQVHHTSQPKFDQPVDKTVEDNAEKGKFLVGKDNNGMSLSLSQQHILHKINLEKTLHTKRKVANVIIFFYLLILSIFYFILEGSKPDIRCFKTEKVKVCTTYAAFDESLIETLTPGIYIYGQTYDESGTRKFIKIKD